MGEIKEAWIVDYTDQDGDRHIETFKRKKQDLVRAGFDPRQVAEPLFYRDARSGDFRALDAARFMAISEGAMRL